MHIPDGYLGPQTYVPLLGVMAGFWAVAIRRLRRTLRLRQVPLLALGAAFSFLIMLFNIPIPGGSTGHAVGAALIAILLGPWAAMVAVSLALIVQALGFGDGGVTAIGANCFTMGVLMPFVGWGTYRLVAAGRPVQSARHWVGAALGGYLGLCAAAIATGALFGIQPLLARGADGQPLYCPFGLGIAVPVMAAEHFLLFGLIEALVTALVVARFQRTAPGLLATGGGDTAPCGRLVPGLAFALGAMVLLSPLGLVLPDRFRAGAAWGEWNGDEVREELARHGVTEAQVPPGIRRAEEHAWPAAMPDYSFRGQEGAPLLNLGLAYIASGLLGVACLGGLVLAMSRWLAQKEPPSANPGLDAGTCRH